MWLIAFGAGVAIRGGHAVADHAVSCGYAFMRCGFWHMRIYFSTRGNLQINTGCFFYCSALKMTKYKEKFKYTNCSAICSSQKVLSVNLQ